MRRLVRPSVMSFRGKCPMGRIQLGPRRPVSSRPASLTPEAGAFMYDSQEPAAIANPRSADRARISGKSAIFSGDSDTGIAVPERQSAPGGSSAGAL
jgi:hypothetical protein